jgi:predicted nucleic acid-binding Zn ribbon protein
MSYKNRDNRKNSVQPLQDILREIMGQQPSISRGIYNSRIPGAWNEVVGPSAARVTKSVWFRNGVVYVTLHSSIIRSELMLHRDTIIRNMNEKIGSGVVTELVLR